jgi:DNA replication protein DnaC
MSVPFIEEHLRALRLPTMLQNYKRLAQGDDNRITYLGELSSLEVNKRHENGVRSRIAAAKFPVIKTMESFDFSLQPELPRRKLNELLDRKFIEEKRNVIFIGKTEPVTLCTS